MIICTRYDVKGIINTRELTFGLGYKEGYLHFYEWLDKPGYFLIHEYDERGWELYDILNRLNHYEELNGECYAYARVKVAKPVSIGVFEHRFRWKFSDYIVKKYATEHLSENQVMIRNKGWYKIENFEPEKWLNEFIEIEIKKEEEIERESMKGQQLDLF